MMRLICSIGLVAVLGVLVPSGEAADTRWDLGGTFTTVPAHANRGPGSDDPTKWVPGVGGWVTLHANELLAIEAEVDGYFPQAELGLLGATLKHKLLAVAGLRLGRRSGPWSLGLKARPGILRSSFDDIVLPPTTSTESDFVLDVGGVVERRSERWLVRLDVGNLWIPSDERGSHPFDEHNLRLSLGVGLSL